MGNIQMLYDSCQTSSALYLSWDAMFCHYLRQSSSLLQVILFVIDQVTADTIIFYKFCKFYVKFS